MSRFSRYFILFRDEFARAFRDPKVYIQVACVIALIFLCGIQMSLPLPAGSKPFSQARHTRPSLQLKKAAFTPKMPDESDVKLVRAANCPVFHAMMAGPQTFFSRISIAEKTWFQEVPPGCLAIFTNDMSLVGSTKNITSRPVFYVQPAAPELEKYPTRMQAWGQLPRVRVVHDEILQYNPSIRWVNLIDDDTYVFHDATAAEFANYDSSRPAYSGYPECIRVSVGDENIFSTQIRDYHLQHGGEYCEFEPQNASVKKCWDICCNGCSFIAQGGAGYMVTRTLVEEIRPHVERCERITALSCESCAEQRLYQCIWIHFPQIQYVWPKGMWRNPPKDSKKNGDDHPTSYHGFEWFDGRSTKSGTLAGEFHLLWDLEQKMRQKRGNEYLLTHDDIMREFVCDGTGYWDPAIDRCRIDN